MDMFYHLKQYIIEENMTVKPNKMSLARGILKSQGIDSSYRLNSYDLRYDDEETGFLIFDAKFTHPDDKFGDSTLFNNILATACHHGHMDLVYYVLNESPECIDLPQDTLYFSPILNAARAGHYELLRFLISKGANVLIPDFAGTDLYDLARMYPEIAEAIGFVEE